MSSNRRVKDEMIEIFGPECFIEKLHLRKPEDIEEEKKRYTSKGQQKIMDQLTYHHIVQKCNGGKATIENGALLKYINHQWLHRLPQYQRDEINMLFQEYKLQVYHKLNIELEDNLNTGIELNLAEIEVTPKEIKVKKLNDKEKLNKQKKIQREKREIQRIKKEYEDR